MAFLVANWRWMAAGALALALYAGLQQPWPPPGPEHAARLIGAMVGAAVVGAIFGLVAALIARRFRR